MPDRCLYLVSSSSTREYVADCLESLALPRGMVMHFRYRTRYIDANLADTLPLEGGKLPQELEGLPVVVVYLYQTQTGGVWRPGETTEPGGPYIPLRCGRLLNAFKDGNVAHFFFELTGYVETDEDGSSRILLKQKVDFQDPASGRISYARLSEDLGFDSPESDDTVAFQSILDFAYAPSEWRTRSLGSTPLDVTYEIVSFRISGVFREENSELELISPTQKVVGSNIYGVYQLESGITYHLRLVMHLPYRSPAALPGQGQATLRLDFNPELIRPLGSTQLRITSFYDLEYWSFIVTSKENRQSSLNIACDYDFVVDRLEFQRTEMLCPEMSLPISIVSRQRSGQVGSQ